MDSSPAESGKVSRGPWARVFKRPVEAVLALILLLLLTPVLLLALVAMKLLDPGPVFFLQERTGRGGRPFRPFKLRTLAVAHVHDPTEPVSLEHPAVTTLGRLLRRTKIDELPQLLNVLRGEMSLVGPRPTLPEQTQRYDEFQRQRLWIRPGLTGLAQVNGNTAIPWDERIRYDVYYVRHHGFWMDLGIACKTARVILSAEQRFARPFADSPYGHSRS